MLSTRETSGYLYNNNYHNASKSLFIIYKIRDKHVSLSQFLSAYAQVLFRELSPQVHSMCIIIYVCYL